MAQRTGGEGVFYVATDEEHLGEARDAARRLSEAGVDRPIAIAARPTASIGAPFDRHIPVESPTNTNRDKVAAIRRTPFERTLFLDTDTYVIDRPAIDSIFEVLKRFDIAVAHDTYRHGRQAVVGDTSTPAPDVPDSFPWFNTGVLAYRYSDGVSQLLERWYDRHESYSTQFGQVYDQIAFRAAAYESDARLTVLPPEFNFLLMAPQQVVDDIRILHGETDNYDALASRLETLLDREPEGRPPYRWSFDPITFGEAYWLIRRRTSWWQRWLANLQLSLERRGLARTVTAAIRKLGGGGFQPPGPR